MGGRGAPSQLHEVAKVRNVIENNRDSGGEDIVTNGGAQGEGGRYRQGAGANPAAPARGMRHGGVEGGGLVSDGDRSILSLCDDCIFIEVRHHC